MRNVTHKRLIAALTAVTLLLDPVGVVFAQPKQRKGETEAAFRGRTSTWWDNQDDRTANWLRSRKGKDRVKPGDWKGLGVRTREEATEVLKRLTKKYGKGTISAADHRAVMAAVDGRANYNNLIAEGRKVGMRPKQAENEFWTAYWKNKEGVATRDDVNLAKAMNQGWWQRRVDLIKSYLPYGAPRTATGS